MSSRHPILATELISAWRVIQTYHPELPYLTEPESFIVRISTPCGVELSFERLLHEAVHGLAATRGVKETSRAGRYHNRRFLSIAQELGLNYKGDPAPGNGFASVRASPETRYRYRDAIEKFDSAVAEALALTSSREEGLFRGPTARRTPPGGGVRTKVTCGCGRLFYIVPSVFALGPISCTLCGQDFRQGSPDENSAPAVPQ